MIPMPALESYRILSRRAPRGKQGNADITSFSEGDRPQVNERCQETRRAMGCVYEEGSGSRPLASEDLLELDCWTRPSRDCHTFQGHARAGHGKFRAGSPDDGDITSRNRTAAPAYIPSKDIAKSKFRACSMPHTPQGQIRGGTISRRLWTFPRVRKALPVHRIACPSLPARIIAQTERKALCRDTKPAIIRSRTSSGRRTHAFKGQSVLRSSFRTNPGSAMACLQKVQ
jgi:hypothetical protein